MKFASRCKLTASGQETVTCPDLTSKRLIPTKCTLMEYRDGEEKPLKDVLCRANAGGVEVYNHSEAYFHLSNELDFHTCLNYVQRNGRLSLNITNRSREVKNVVVYTEYEPNEGSVIYSDKLDHFESVLPAVHQSGRCNRLVLSFNRPIKALQCATTAECLDGSDQWISSFDITVEEGEDPTYVLEFTEESGLEEYQDYLNYLQLKVVDGADEDTQRHSPLVLYVLAYGFPRN